MRKLKSFRLFESTYKTIRSYNSHLEDKFLIYDEIIKDINKLYDNVSIEHRGNRYYDIYYKIESGENENIIHIGGYDISTNAYYLFKCKSIDEYSSQGNDYNNVIYLEYELNEETFDIFVNMWYDIYDLL